MFTDYHVHTYYSYDSDYFMEDVVKDAITMGMDEICFTDHVDYGPFRDLDDPRGIEYYGEMRMQNVDYPNYFKELKRMQEKYDGKIVIKKGLEYGMQKHTIEDYRKLYERYPLDFVILSIHDIDDLCIGLYQYQEGKDVKEYHHGFYRTLYEIMEEYKDYSVLGHLDYINRHDRVHVPFETDRDDIAEVLKLAIKDGKGIEINTSSYRYGVGEWTPAEDVVKLYRDLGGRIITFGSDSHKPEHLGAHIKEKMEVLKDMGFKETCTFEEMKPVFHRL